MSNNPLEGVATPFNDQESPLSRAFIEGRKGYFDFLSLTENPYEEGDEEFYAWQDGWMEAEQHEQA